MSAWTWLVVPLLPLLALLALWRWPTRAPHYLWLASLPALILACWPPASLGLTGLWPGARWGVEDLLGRSLLGFSALLWAAAAVYASASQAQDARRGRFWLFWLLALAGNLLLIIAADGASFYVGFTLMSLSAYGLVVHRGGTGPRQAGRVYLQLAVLGELVLYAGLLLRVHEAGGLTAFADWQEAPVGALTAGLLLLGFGLKAGFWPLHLWLPLAHPAAPAAASAVLSGAMIKAGILGLWQFLPASSPLLQHWAPWLLAVGLISAFYGAALGLLQQRAKAALAYSSVSQMGYLLALLALAWWQPEARALWGGLLALYMVHHAIAKGALFLGAGIASGHRLRPWQWLVMALPGLALAGLPLTTGGAVKSLFKSALAQSPAASLGLLLSVGSLATALLIARALWLMRSEARAPLTDRVLLGPWLLLSLLALLLPWGWPVLRAALGSSMALDETWALFWPVALAMLVAWVLIRTGWSLPGRWRLSGPARWLSLRLKRLLQRPPLPAAEVATNKGYWRQRERAWNRQWRVNAVTLSVWLLAVLLVLGWVW